MRPTSLISADERGISQKVNGTEISFNRANSIGSNGSTISLSSINPLWNAPGQQSVILPLAPTDYVHTSLTIPAIHGPLGTPVSTNFFSHTYPTTNVSDGTTNIGSIKYYDQMQLKPQLTSKKPTSGVSNGSSLSSSNSFSRNPLVNTNSNVIQENSGTILGFNWSKGGRDSFSSNVSSARLPKLHVDSNAFTDLSAGVLSGRPSKQLTQVALTSKDTPSIWSSREKAYLVKKPTSADNVSIYKSRRQFKPIGSLFGNKVHPASESSTYSIDPSINLYSNSQANSTIKTSYTNLTSHRRPLGIKTATNQGISGSLSPSQLTNNHIEGTLRAATRPVSRTLDATINASASHQIRVKPSRSISSRVGRIAASALGLGVLAATLGVVIWQAIKNKNMNPQDPNLDNGHGFKPRAYTTELGWEAREFMRKYWQYKDNLQAKTDENYAKKALHSKTSYEYTIMLQLAVNNSNRVLNKSFTITDLNWERTLKNYY